jgi:tellurite resistance protein TerB
MSGFLQSLRRSFRSQLDRYRNRPFLRAAMAACALVATASGSVSFRQRTRVDLVMETLDALKVFDPHEGVDLFNDFVAALSAESNQERRLAREVVSAEAAHDPERARQLLRICLAVSECDGAIPPPERHEIEAICRWIGIDPDVCAGDAIFRPGIEQDPA